MQSLCVKKNKYNISDVLSVSQLSFYEAWKTVSTRVADSVYVILLPMTTVGKWRC